MVDIIKLPNGLTLAVQPEHSHPLVTIDMWVRVGSGDEPAEIAGISHFLEHMMFKGTERLAVGEYDRRIEEIGGYLNAATSYDYTHYYVTFPSEHFDRVLTDFADVMQNSAFDPGEVESERKVILEEIRRKDDSPFGYLMTRAIPGIYTSGPYEHPVIGFPETVASMTRDQLYEHYRRHYAADRMFLCVSGDVNPDHVRARAAEEFRSLPSESRPWREEPPQTEYADPSHRLYPRDWNEAYFMMVFPGPEPDGIRSMALADQVQEALAGGRSSRLVRHLVEKAALATSIDAYIPSHNHSSAIMIYGTCRRDQLEELRRALLAEVRRLRDQGITRDEMARAHRQASTAHLFSLETGAGRAATLGYSFARLDNASLLTEYHEALNRVSRHDIDRFLAEYLVEERASFFVTARDALGGGG